MVVTKHGSSIDPNQRDSDSPEYTFYKSKRLNKYKKKVYKKTKNLLTGSTEQDEEYQKVSSFPFMSIEEKTFIFRKRMRMLLNWYHIGIQI